MNTIATTFSATVFNDLPTGDRARFMPLDSGVTLIHSKAEENQGYFSKT